MLFAIYALDKTGSSELRAATRDSHLAYLDGFVSQMLLAGPLLNEAGQAVGSLIVVEAETQTAVEALAAADPYAQAGLFESVAIRPYRAVYKDAARQG